MNDDLGRKVQQIAQMLGQNDLPDNLKELVALFAESMGKKEDCAQQPAPPAEESNEHPADEEDSSVRDILEQAVKAMNRMSTPSDPRINLLQAIKPFMNNKRQRKIGNCIELLQIAGLSRMLNDRKKQEG